MITVNTKNKRSRDSKISTWDNRRVVQALSAVSVKPKNNHCILLKIFKLRATQTITQWLFSSRPDPSKILNRQDFSAF